MGSYMFYSLFNEMYGLIFGSPLTLPLTFVFGAVAFVYHYYVSQQRELQQVTHQGCSSVSDAEIVERSPVNLNLTNHSNYDHQSRNLDYNTSQNGVTPTQTEEAHTDVNSLNRNFNNLQNSALSGTQVSTRRAKRRKHNLKICSEKILDQNVSVNLNQNFEEKNSAKEKCVDVEIKILNNSTFQQDHPAVETAEKVSKILNTDNECNSGTSAAIASLETHTDAMAPDLHKDYGQCSKQRTSYEIEFYNNSCSGFNPSIFVSDQDENSNCAKQKHKNEKNGSIPVSHSGKQAQSSHSWYVPNAAAENCESDILEPVGHNKKQRQSSKSCCEPNKVVENYERKCSKLISQFIKQGQSCDASVKAAEKCEKNCSKPESHFIKHGQSSKSCYVLSEVIENCAETDNAAYCNNSNELCLTYDVSPKTGQINPKINSTCNSGEQECDYEIVDSQEITNFIDQYGSSSEDIIKKQIKPVIHTLKHRQSKNNCSIPDFPAENCVNNENDTHSDVLRKLSLPNVNSKICQANSEINSEHSSTGQEPSYGVVCKELSDTSDQSVLLPGADAKNQIETISDTKKDGNYAYSDGLIKLSLLADDLKKGLLNSTIDPERSSVDKKPRYEGKELSSCSNQFPLSFGAVAKKQITRTNYAKAEGPSIKSYQVADVAAKNDVDIESDKYFTASSNFSLINDAYKKCVLNPEINAQSSMSNDQERNYKLFVGTDLSSSLDLQYSPSTDDIAKNQSKVLSDPMKQGLSHELCQIGKVGIGKDAYSNALYAPSLYNVYKKGKVNPSINSDYSSIDVEPGYEVIDFEDLGDSTYQQASSTGAILKKQIKSANDVTKQGKASKNCQVANASIKICVDSEEAAYANTLNTFSLSNDISSIELGNTEIEPPFSFNPQCSSSSGAISKKRYMFKDVVNKKPDCDQDKSLDVGLYRPTHIKKTFMSKFRSPMKKAANKYSSIFKGKKPKAHRENPFLDLPSSVLNPDVSVQELLISMVKKTTELCVNLHEKNLEGVSNHPDENSNKPVFNILTDEPESCSYEQRMLVLEQKLCKLERNLKHHGSEEDDEFADERQGESVEPLSQFIHSFSVINKKLSKIKMRTYWHKLSKKLSDAKVQFNNFISYDNINPEHINFETDHKNAENPGFAIITENVESLVAEGGVQSLVPVSSPVSEEDLCTGCYEVFSNSVNFPCGHSYLCFPCAKEVFQIYKKCCVCDEKIDSVQRLGS